MAEMTPEQMAALKAQVGPMLKALGLDMDIFDSIGEITDEFKVVKRTVRILATWARSHDPEGFERAKAVILNAEENEKEN